MAVRLHMTLILMSSLALLHMVQCNADQSDLESAMNYRYVTPSRNVPCNGNEPCLTLEEYASDPAYFSSDTIFYFYPGNHQLNTSLELCGIHHFYFQAVDNDIVSITFDELVGITWINCTDISMSSICFYVTENFTHLLVFENTSAINLSNFAITNDMNRVGCSAILIKDSDEVNFLDTCFIGISGTLGAALAVDRSNITFSGNTTFMYNHGYSGGAIFSINSSLIFIGNNTFMNNTAPYDELTIHDTTLCRYSNTATAVVAESDYVGSGGAVASFCSLLTISGYSTLVKNYAGEMGGAIHTSSLDWPSGGNCSILRINGNCTFADNQADSGGAIMAISSLIFEGPLVKFVNNFANDFGGALTIFGSVSEVKFLSEKVSFSNNNISGLGGAMQVTAASVFFSSINAAQNSTEFYGNCASVDGGAIICDGCNLFFNSNVIFNENTADYGGAISFINFFESRQPVLTLYPDYTLYFIRNHAITTGGALQVNDPSACYLSPQCFISFATASSNSTGNVSLVFVNNSAGQAGSVLYGGELNKCVVYYSGNETSCNTHGKRVYSNQAMETFINISTIISQENVSDISSDTVHICFCNEKFEPKCGLGELTAMIELFPGQLFNVTLVGLGQGNHPVPSKIISQIDTHYFGEFSLSPAIHSIYATCTIVYYRSYSNNIGISTGYNFYPDTPCHFLYDGVEIDISFKQCPPGFVLRNQICDCDKWLNKFTQNCYIDNLSIERTKNNFWISLDTKRTGLLFTSFGCPLDFCINNRTNVTLNDPNSQSSCDFNRSGILCGSCRDSLSLTLGSLHCISCSNLYILLVVPFALAGVALVMVILLLHLTVDVGTINGLLFYANIIQANRQAFFPRSINFFTVFISWLNLDLGIETCLYDGLTFYVYSWLQFLFPFYIWMLITLIIVVSNYSLTVAKYLGSFNPVAVLATLLLMSYGKILQAIIVPLRGVYLTQRDQNDPTEYHHAIWLYDGNIGFFTDSGHIILAIFCILMLLCLFLPYTLILLCGHCLQACSHRRFLTWINKLKPFLDAHYAPYRNNGCYWTGLLLVTRGGLFITFATNVVGSESFNILAICSVVIALLAIKGRVYENCYIDVLESSFLLNLGVLSVATIYIRENELGNTSQAILSGLSVGTAFVTFFGIFLFHVLCQLKRMNEGMFLTANERLFTHDKNKKGDHNHPKVEREFILSAAQLRESLLETNTINYGTY